MSQSDIDKEAMACSAFWAKHPDAERCLKHPTSIFSKQPEPGRKAIPHSCQTCAEEFIDTPEGRVLNHYSRLIFPADPPNPTCPNCGSALVPSRQDLGTSVAA